LGNFCSSLIAHFSALCQAGALSELLHLTGRWAKSLLMLDGWRGEVGIELAEEGRGWRLGYCCPPTPKEF